VNSNICIHTNAALSHYIIHTNAALSEIRVSGRQSSIIDEMFDIHLYIYINKYMYIYVYRGE